MKPDRFDLGACLALIVLTVAIYAPTASFDFIGFDDDSYVTENPLVLGGLHLESAGRAFTHFRSSNWHPLTWISHMADVSLFGLDSGAHHAVNTGLHALASCLLFLVWRRFTASSSGGLAPRATVMSFVVAALFAVHPAHVESVAWIAERKDLLCAVFWMLTLGAYLRYARSPSAARYALVALALAAALMAKPMAVSLPLVLLGLDFWPLRRWRALPASGPPVPVGAPAPAGRLLLEKLPLVALVAVSSALTLYAQNIGSAIQPLSLFSFGARVANAVLSYDRYLLIAAWPMNLNIYYPRLDPLTFTATGTALALVPLVSLTAFSLWQWRRRPFLLVGWAWFVVTLVPVIGLVQVGGQAIADRYTYLPFVGLSIALVWGVESFWPQHTRRSFTLVVMALLSIGLCSFLASRQVFTWISPEVLWRNALAANERNPMAHSQLSQILALRGEFEAARFHAALAIEYEPEMFYAHYQMGMLLLQLGHHDLAREYLEHALSLDGRSAPAVVLLAEIDRREGKLSEAISGFERGFAMGRRTLRGPAAEEGLVLALRSQYETAREGGGDLDACRADYLRIQATLPHLKRVAADFRQLEAETPAGRRARESHQAP